MESHDRFLSIPADTFVLPAHNLPFLRRARTLAAAHRSPRRSHAGHRGTLRVTPATARELLPVLFARKLDPRQMMMALGEAIAHVHLLLHRNRLERSLV